MTLCEISFFWDFSPKLAGCNHENTPFRPDFGSYMNNFLKILLNLVEALKNLTLWPVTRYFKKKSFSLNRAIWSFLLLLWAPFVGFYAWKPLVFWGFLVSIVKIGVLTIFYHYFRCNIFYFGGVNRTFK